MSVTFVPSTEPLSNRDRNMLDRAIVIAAQSTCKQKHGAVIYKGGRVLAVGINSTRNQHPTMEIEAVNYTYHAEIAAIRAAGRESVKDSTLYIARINRRGNPVYSGPCEECMNRVFSTGIKRVVFTA